MLARFSFLIRETQLPNSHFNGVGVLRPSGGAMGLPDTGRFERSRCAADAFACSRTDILRLSG